jgi:hypothetical protein
LDCGSIGGGDSNTGAPGSVSAEIQDDPTLPNYNPLGAGIYIAGNNKITVKSGYIGGGVNTVGDIGKATAYINATNSESTIQGQFILCNNTSTTTDHCFFVMEAGTLDNTNLGAIGAVNYPRKKAEGGAVYMEDLNGVVSISGGTIRNATGTLGGAIYMTHGTFTQDGGAIYSNNATDKGGAVYLGGGTVTVNGGTIGGTALASGNTATNYGGGIYLAGGSFTMNGGSVQYNKATNEDGGGIYIFNGGTATMHGGTIMGNQATSGDGGGLYVNPGSSVTTYIDSNVANTVISGNKAKNGGGAYIHTGRLSVASTNGHKTTIGGTSLTDGNEATSFGGGVYLAEGTFELTSGDIQYNTSNNTGGGLYLANGNITVSGANATIKGNKAKNFGGGIYVGAGNFTMTGGTIGGTTVEGNKTDSLGYGGGLYMGSGTATLTNGTLSGNAAPNGYGGAIFMNGGSCTLKGGSMIGGENADYANVAKHGGGIYSGGGTIKVKGGKIAFNQAVNGGGIYSYGESPKVYVEKEVTGKADVLSYIEHNTADYGGGIYARRGEVHFSDGFIQYNLANRYGGGMYVDTIGTLYLKGSANLKLNHVPGSTDGTTNGGGVYLLGTVTVGETGATGTILAQDNYKGDSYQYNPDNGLNNRNNVFLPAPQNPEVLTNHRDIITVIYNGINENSKVGFSVPRNYVPVIYCENNNEPCTEAGYTDYTTSQRFLHKFSTSQPMQHNLFDDTERYIAVHYVDQPDIFDPDHVYLYGFWTHIVTTNPFTPNDTIGDIDTREKLAYFISWVNGLNDRKDKGPRPNAVGNITADIDMSEFGWVPIGAVDTVVYANSPGFSGVINGNGHTITGISSLAIDPHKAYGLVGQLKGGTIKDLYVKDAQYALEYVDGLVIGGLVGDATGNAQISNSEVSCNIKASHPNAIAGGLIGRTGNDNTEPNIHSCIGIADMEGYEMGGLIGRNVKGNLYNSFANAQFTVKDSTKYVGGLVGVNGGTVANCYVRLRGANPTGNFGLLVGNNTNGEVDFCYAPANMTDMFGYTANDTVAGTLVGHGKYGKTELPYLYRHRDTQVTLADGGNDFIPSEEDADKQMLIALNSWVDEMNTGGMAYTKWGRPWQESDANKPLNDDYPILKMPSSDAVAAKAGDPYLYYNPINKLLASRTAADEAIWMYRNNAAVTGTNAESAAKLYIDEHVALINNDTIKAYVGITLDNSAGAAGAYPTYFDVPDATDWHMFSTPLTKAPVGIDYNGDGAQHAFDWDHPSDMPYYRFFPKDDLKHGYFPSHRFGTDFPADNGDPTLPENEGNYYEEWDFYSYYEPEYHWINFKRNSASHWHMDDPAQTLQIMYNNEDSLVLGKGYFAATREETFLQCSGTLNRNGFEYPVTQTAGVPRHGYNLLGNPYQAYLDFNALASANIAYNGSSFDETAIWDSLSVASYTILDEDSARYVTFSYKASDNPATAGRYIHPHQGFFVQLQRADSALVTFEPGMRNATAEDVTFRDESRPNYPLVNLYVKEANGNSDVVTVELGRPDRGGAPMMQNLRTGRGRIWCHYGDADWSIAYTQPGETEVGIRFETAEDTEYTLRWDTYNGEFSYLHLIDNMTGADVDCLSTREYKFTSRTSDYKSRFRLVFGYTGMEEQEEASEAGFAFMMGDEMVVNGEGVLQVFDVNGRMLVNRELHGVQNTLSLPEVADGVYVLRLTEGKQSRIQKMVISK